tara:strand:- start:1030 stop:1206 length:177 start_codon:yes stop_codon:yes gene_type:complete
MKDTNKKLNPDNEKHIEVVQETEKEMNESFDDFLKDLSDRNQPSCDIDNPEDCDSCGS